MGVVSMASGLYFKTEHLKKKVCFILKMSVIDV